MITDKDTQKLLDAFLNVFATKNELRQTKDELKDEMRNHEDRIFTRMDAVYKEVKDMREEQSAHFQSHDDNRTEHTGFESRLKTVESSIALHKISR